MFVSVCVCESSRACFSHCMSARAAAKQVERHR